MEPSRPTPGPSDASFTTAGVTANWTSLSWSQLTADDPLATANPDLKLIAWRGGYAVYGTTSVEGNAFVWTSADGQTWTQVTAIVAPLILVAASPTGLVAVAGDPSATVPSETVWTSSDGVQWRNAGSPFGLAFVDSIAGTSVGLVATEHTLSGSGKFATSVYSVAFSTDGITWTPVVVQPGITWDEVGPQVQSGNGRFFAMGGYTAGLASAAAYRLDTTGAVGTRGPVAAGFAGKGGLWWSDDGRTWTSTGDWVYASKLVFGRDGILAYVSQRLIPGGTSLELSTDGGKTWQDDRNFGPVGAVVCGQGECADGPDGVISSNGTLFLAVKSNGKAWVSYDAKTWTAIALNSPFPGYYLVVLPRGVVADGSYGAAK